jgi:hypothetical protein
MYNQSVNAISLKRPLYHGYCEDQRKAVFIILQCTHSYWKIDAHHYMLRENKSVEFILENKDVLVISHRGSSFVLVYCIECMFSSL